MKTNRYIEECKDESRPHLPMGRLFYLLHSNGFDVKPDDYIEMLKITERFGSANIDETAKWICPIIATSETEQLKFYNIIEQYKKIESAQTCERPVYERKFPRWFKIALFFFFLLFLLLTIYLSLQKNVYRLEETNKERTVKKGQPLLLDASTLLRGRPADSTQIQFT